MCRPAIFCLLVQLIFELSSCAQLRVVPGSTVELPCLSFQTDFVGADITWKYNGQDLASALSPGAAQVKKGGLYLSMSPVTAAHEGEYVCLVKENDVELIRTYNITVDASFIYSLRAIEGSTVHLPCHFPPSSKVEADAVWFKETDAGKRTRLNLDDDSDGDDNRLELLYPSDHDQTIILRNTIRKDAGIYQCESPEGEKLSTVHLVVEVAPTVAPYSCEGFTDKWEPCQDENSRTGEPVLQESMAEFSFKLYSYIRESNPSSNLLFSPISISGMLSHLLLGARGDTRRAIETAVCVPHDFHCVHVQIKKLREKLASSLQVASQVYYNPEISLSESFMNQSTSFYDAEPVKLLKTSEENTLMINSWVANKTNNKITEVVDSVSMESQLLLLNAVSFSGQWKVKFEEKPQKGLFRKLNGDLITVPLLYHNKYLATMAYDVDLKAQIARFALTDENSLFILLPLSNKVSDLQHVEERMTDTVVRQMIQQMRTAAPQQLEVTLPQIKLEIQPNMNILMKKLGLSSLFEASNLCGFSEDQLILNDARHKAFLRLTEQGVEASAATTVVHARSFPAFSALRPFIMLLWSDLADVPLFIGRVTEP